MKTSFDYKYKKKTKFIATNLKYYYALYYALYIYFIEIIVWYKNLQGNRTLCLYIYRFYFSYVFFYFSNKLCFYNQHLACQLGCSAKWNLALSLTPPEKGFELVWKWVFCVFPLINMKSQWTKENYENSCAKVLCHSCCCCSCCSCCFCCCCCCFSCFCC